MEHNLGIGLLDGAGYMIFWACSIVLLLFTFWYGRAFGAVNVKTWVPVCQPAAVSQLSTMNKMGGWLLSILSK